jgi:3-deoxy-D-manno-octulosonate 8-phosphate phosphatase (KDO 8-P phosphatase)
VQQSTLPEGPALAAGPSGQGGEAIRDELAHLIRRVRLVAFDFDGVFTDNSVYVSEDGKESVRCWRSDGLGLRELRRLGIATIIISTETNAVVTTRSRKLAIACVQGCEDKRATLDEVMREHGLSLEEVAFVGNDINDLCCLDVVGLPIVVQDAHPSVIPAARYRTRTPGGYGAVREVCDLFTAVLEDQPR